MILNVASGPDNITPTSTGNTVGTTNSVAGNNDGVAFMNIRGGSTISYSTGGYTSVGATAMQYAIHYRVQYMGN